MLPIKIIGAGPAGLMAAITLAQAGCPVTVYERAASVGVRHDGDLEAIENWTTPEDMRTELAGWGLSVNFDCVPLCSGTWFGPGFGQMTRLVDKQPLLYLVRRGPQAGTLERGLLAQAQAAGVQVLFHRSGVPDEADIIATGLTRPGAYGVGYNFQTNAPNGAYVCYDRAMTPKSYAYLALAEGQGTVMACGLVPQRGLRQALPRVVAGFQGRVPFAMREPTYFAASIGLNIPQSARRNGRLYIGEAGNFQDVFAGFGIRMALTTGYLAAQSLLHGDDYDTLWQAHYAPLIQAAVVNRWLQETGGNSGYRLALWYMGCQSEAGRLLLSRLYRPMWYTPLLWPLARRAFQAKAQPSCQT